MISSTIPDEKWINTNNEDNQNKPDSSIPPDLHGVYISYQKSLHETTYNIHSVSQAQNTTEKPKE